MTIVRLEGQSIYDICLQCYGVLDYIYKLITDNNISNIEASLEPNQRFIFDEALIVDSVVFKMNEQKDIVYRTLEEGASFDDSFDDSFDI